MLQWQWPRVWSDASREAVRVALETALRAAMAGGDDTQVRGTVCVDLPNMGVVPPQLALVDVRVVSLAHTAVTVRCRYNGDCAVTLRGLQINLDTVNSGGGVDDGETALALPFFCPFELTLCDLVIDGTASIDVYHDVVPAMRTAATATNSSSATTTTTATSTTATITRGAAKLVDGHGDGRAYPSLRGTAGGQATANAAALSPGASAVRVASAASNAIAHARRTDEATTPHAALSMQRANDAHTAAVTAAVARSAYAGFDGGGVNAGTVTSSGGSSSNNNNYPHHHHRGSSSDHSSATTMTSRIRASVSSPGYGILAAVGGRRAMRPPLQHGSNVCGVCTDYQRRGSSNNIDEHAVMRMRAAGDELTSAASLPLRSGHARDVASAATTGSVVDLLSGDAVVARRRVKVQLFGHPLKSFRVVSNFDAVPGVNARVGETIRQLVKPAIERMMSSGVTLPL